MTDMIGHAGLRERKKARTRAALREHALRLFREQGYQATTVEQIAGAADVSPSTFFRYFPTKEDVVLQDDMDVRVIEAFARQPPELSPIAAVRAAMREAWTSFTDADWELIRQGGELSMRVPEIRARAINEFARSITVVAEALAERVGRGPDDFQVRVVAGAVIGVMMAVFIPDALPDEFDEAAAEAAHSHLGPESVAQIDDALAQLEAGLPL
jgi:AcrR family transcriptional regulator